MPQQYLLKMALLQYHNMCKWISVNDRLPDFGEKVFVCYDPKNIYEGKPKQITTSSRHKINQVNHVVRGMFDKNHFACSNGTVIYWMPIPKIPTE
jgi:hypothetical protein